MYKTIVLELLEARPALHRHLRLHRVMLPELARYARDLRAAHKQSMDAGMDAGAAMEMAVAEIEERLDRETARLEA